MAKRAPSLYLLTRIAPEASQWTDEPWFYTHDGGRLSSVPVAGFVTKKEADEARKRLERAARETAPIAWFLRELIPVRMTEIVDAAHAAGLPPPDFSAVGPAPKPKMQGGYPTYTSEDSEYSDRVLLALYAWWAAVSVGISPHANALLWNVLLPDYTFYSVHRVLIEE